MTHDVWRHAVLFSLVAALSAPTAAQAQEVPFKISGSGLAPDALPLPGEPARKITASGHATHLGHYTGEGTIETTSATFGDGIITGEFGGEFTFIAANGDRLATTFGRSPAPPGTFTLTILDVLADGSLVVEGEFLAEFVVLPDQSTGRFAGVTGSWIMDAHSDPFVLGSSDSTPFTWEGQGTLTFPKKAK
jgi:hypothetical protein